MTTQITHIKMMKKKMLASPLVILLSFVSLFIVAPPTEAYPEGILGHHGAEGATCTRCHNGGAAPEMGLSGGRDVVAGETILYTLVITSGAPEIQQYAGFNLVIASPDGNSYAAGLTPLDSSTKTEYAELTHTAPQANDADGVARFAFEWIVPAETGAYSFYFAANSANGDGSTSGDMSARAIEMVNVTAGSTTTATNQAPVVSFMQPMTTTFAVGSDIPIVAEAADDGTIASVQLFIDGAAKRVDDSAPYRWNNALTAVEAGTYLLELLATDDLGVSTTAALTITVTDDSLAPLSVMVRQIETAVYTHTLFLLTYCLMTLTAVTLTQKTRKKSIATL